jgi:hypothetical protein
MKNRVNSAKIGNALYSSVPRSSKILRLRRCGAIGAPNSRHIALLRLVFLTEREIRPHTLSLIATGAKPCPAVSTSRPRCP